MSEGAHELSVSCTIAAPRATCWAVWTDRKAEWFCPKPWRAEVIEEDLRPGGRSAVQMFGPDGEETGPMEGVFLEVVPGERVVTTDAYAAGWVPQTPFITADFGNLYSGLILDPHDYLITRGIYSKTQNIISANYIGYSCRGKNIN